MIRLNSDYNEGAHENILEKLFITNMEQTSNYGEDNYCMEAADIIKKLCRSDDSDVHFLVGGTQANLVVISSALRPHQCVLCADTGHINVHETGAIEACGHKVVTLESKDGKITADQIKQYYELHKNDPAREHITQPKLIYISNPTELGTIYTKEELEELSNVCKERQLYLYMDGARLSYALCAQNNNLTLPLISEYCDVFYIGGTKCGALFGEAVVINNICIKEDFRYIMKQKGAMLAKGRLLGIQFLELFRDGLYFRLADHANHYALILKNKFKELGFEFYVDSYTNQQFVILPDDLLKLIDEKYTYSYCQRYDSKNSVVRFCTSWASKEDDINAFFNDINHYILEN